MYGVFFEDINYGADGGLYGELVKNWSFEFPQPLMGWNTIGGVAVKAPILKSVGTPTRLPSATTTI